MNKIITIKFLNEEYTVDLSEFDISDEIDKTVISKFLFFSELSNKANLMLEKFKADEKKYIATTVNSLVGVFKSEKAKEDKLISNDPQKFIDFAYGEAELSYIKNVFNDIAKAYQMKNDLQIVLYKAKKLIEK